MENQGIAGCNHGSDAGEFDPPLGNRGIACGFRDGDTIPPPQGNFTSVIPKPLGTEHLDFEPQEVPLKVNGEVVGRAKLRQMDEGHMLIIGHIDNGDLAELLAPEKPHLSIRAETVNITVARD